MVYRFMSAEELARLTQAAKAYQGKPKEVVAAAGRLTQEMKRLMELEDFGNQIQDFTMTPYGGGQIGTPDQFFVATTADPAKLSQSTDDTVQKIVRGAAKLATFRVPKSAAIGAPSDLSQEEAEVLVPNMLSELGAMLIAGVDNPYKQ